MGDTLLQPVTVSIVSHGQGGLVSKLLEDLACCPSVSRVIVTHNIPEEDFTCPASLKDRVRVIRNMRRQGFAENHNQAFRHCETSLFAVLNPDIRLNTDPFPKLVEALVECSAGMVAPQVRTPLGKIEDSARRFPTVSQLVVKLFGGGDGRIVLNGTNPQPVDWVAGMFMLFQSDKFRAISGFDERFFLYYEDVDVCVRLWNAGWAVVLHPEVSVVHEARRTSRRNLRYMAWHLSSMARYFLKDAWCLPRRATRL